MSARSAYKVCEPGLHTFVDQNHAATGPRGDQLNAFLAEPVLADPEAVRAPDSVSLDAILAALSDPETVLATTCVFTILPPAMWLIMMPMWSFCFSLNV
jgi:hypothetical protein